MTPETLERLRALERRRLAEARAELTHLAGELARAETRLRELEASIRRILEDPPPDAGTFALAGLLAEAARGRRHRLQTELAARQQQVEAQAATVRALHSAVERWQRLAERLRQRAREERARREAETHADLAILRAVATDPPASEDGP